MADYIKKINTTTGAKQIDYEALANLPKINGQELVGDVTLETGGPTAEDVQTALDTAKSYADTQDTAAISAHNTSDAAHTDIRGLITDLTTRLNALADSDDTTLDQLSEIVAYIKSNKELIDAITTSKVSVADIIDNLESTDTNKPLSANQGKVLKDLITALTSVVDGKATSEHTHDSDDIDIDYTQLQFDTTEIVS